MRRSREDWLESGIKILGEAGVNGLTIERMAAEMSLTKGSFYHHFRSREDFVQSVGRYWAVTFTTAVKVEIGSMKGGFGERLLSLMEMVVRGDLSRYDRLMRCWSIRNAAIRRLTKRTFNERIRYVESLLKGMGHRGEDLNARVHVFVGYMTFETEVNAGLPLRKRLDRLKAVHAVIVNG